MKLRDMAPLPSERGFIVGTTGSGKTTLATRLLRYYSRVVAIDPKGTLGSGGDGSGRHLPGYDLAKTPRELEFRTARSDHVQYRPDMKFQTPEQWERIFDFLYRQGHRLIYNDELADVHHFNMAPPSLRRIITSGRELAIAHLGATQRPRQIDRRIMSEAERWYVFHLRDQDDIRLMRSLGRIGKQQLPEYSFWYTRDVSPFHPPAVRRIRI